MRWVPAVRDPGGNMKMRSLGSRLMALMLSLCIAVPPLLQARVEPSHGFDMFSPQEEVQAGQQASAQASKQLPLLPDSDPAVKYVQRLGAQLAAHAPGEKWPYSFHVVKPRRKRICSALTSCTTPASIRMPWRSSSPKSSRRAARVLLSSSVITPIPVTVFNMSRKKYPHCRPRASAAIAGSSTTSSSAWGA